MLDYVKGTSSIEPLDQEFIKRQQIRHKKQLIESLGNSEDQVGQHRLDKVSNPGYWVLLKLQPFRQKLVIPRVNSKLS